MPRPAVERGLVAEADGAVWSVVPPPPSPSRVATRGTVCLAGGPRRRRDGGRSTADQRADTRRGDQGGNGIGVDGTRRRGSRRATGASATAVARDRSCS